MAKSSGVRCTCGEVQFTVIDDYETTDGNVLDIIICDSCANPYKKPIDFVDENGRYE